MSIGTQSRSFETLPPPSGTLYRLSVEKYLDLTRAGVFTEDDRVELLEGVLVAQMAKKPPHVLATKRIFSALSACVPAGWHVSKEDPIRLADSVPEPDCAIVRGSAEDYASHLPGSADVPLVVEVSDATLAQDRADKQRAYARAAIPVYWLANLVARRFEVYTEPSGPADAPGYRNCVCCSPGETIPVLIDGREVGRLVVADLLP